MASDHPPLPTATEMTSAQRNQLLRTCKAALDSFIASDSPFRVVSTIGSRPVPVPEPDTLTPATLPPLQPRTLFILDSSYNPPSRAHSDLASSAVAAARGSSRARYPPPIRLLLLFSTHNADKEAKPAAFEHRLAMMVVFARDLQRKLQQQRLAGAGVSRAAGTDGEGEGEEDVDIDIGLTTEPFYHAKSAAIDASDAGRGADPRCQTKTQHVHLVGFDTITRIFAPRYYASHDPPLSALSTFFARHGLRATVRPASSMDEGGGGDVDEEAELREQLGWVAEHLASGKLEAQGGKREWADKVEMVEAEEEGKDVSSTKVRTAVQKADWEGVRACCTDGVVEWVREFGLYAS